MAGLNDPFIDLIQECRGEQAVVVAVQIKPNHAADQNRPQRHAGTAKSLAERWCDLAFQSFEYRDAQRKMDVDELQASQNPGNVIA